MNRSIKAAPNIFGILNDTDKPEAKMIVVTFGPMTNRKFAYVTQTYGWHGVYTLGDHDRFTPLSDFGVRCRMTEDAGLRVTRHTISVATYADGSPRPWQGDDDAIIEIVHAMMGKVARAVYREFEVRKEARLKEKRSAPMTAQTENQGANPS